MASARARAVPLGASSFRLWCFSRISISNPAAARTGEISFNTLISRLIPTDIFAERRTALVSLSLFTLKS